MQNIIRNFSHLDDTARSKMEVHNQPHDEENDRIMAGGNPGRDTPVPAPSDPTKPEPKAGIRSL